MGLNAVQSYPAERVLVAALLGRPASFYELGGRVTEEMFTEPGLRLVFRAFAELASRGERIDMATVEAEMFRLDHRLYGELNGVSFLSAMLQAVRNDSHIHEYVRLVQREWMLRGCVASLNKRGLEAQQPDVDVMKLLAGVTDDMDGLREHASGGVDVRMAAEVAREVLARSFRNQEAREKGEHIQVRTGFDELALRAAFDGKDGGGFAHGASGGACGAEYALFQHRDERGGGDGTYPFDAERRGGRQDPFQGDEPRGACVVGESGG